MILPFSVKFPNGQSTDFVGKIWAGLLNDESFEFNNYTHRKLLVEASDRNLIYDVNFVDEYRFMYKPKRHSIREDAKDRWRKGMKIDFIVFNRSKNMFKFAPNVECRSTQTIEIIRTSDYLDQTIVKVDGRQLDTFEIRDLAWNDGFENLISFWLYFSEGFKGKIIHWTDLNY